jgi:rhomboid protease GluP
MNNFKLKLQHILLPYIIITLGVTLTYLIFYWLVVIKIEAEIKNTLTNFVIPGAIASAAILIWLRPRIKRLIFKNDNGHFLYYMVATGANLWLIIVCAKLLTLKTNDIVHLKDITEIESNTRSGYYSIEDFSIVDLYGSSTYTVSRSGKNNQYVDFDLYFAAPIAKKDKKIDSTKVYKYWIVQSYSTRESAHSDDEKLNKAFTDFANTSDLDFHYQKFLNGLDHFERVKPSDEKIQGMVAVKKSEPNAIPEDIILLRASTSNLAEEASSALKYIFISFFSGIGVVFLLLIYPKYKEEKPNQKKRIKKQDDLRDMLMFLVPRGEHYITSILLDINIVVFILLLFLDVDFMSPTAPQLVAVGGLNATMFANGEYWRLLTSMFLHAGFGHILYNMIALVLVGLLIEPVLGRKRYLLLYIGSGIISAFTVVLFGKAGVSVGASGAIFGLFAVGFTYAVLNKIKPLITMIGIYAGSSLLLGFIIPGTDNVGHLGGIAGGLLIYFVMREIYPELKDYAEDGEDNNKTSQKAL